MSTITVNILTIDKLAAHPNADRLDIVQVLGANVCVPKGQYKVGQKVVYFPPNILIPEPVAQSLGVKNYLKHSVYPGDVIPTQCRVAACRLRGVPSFGFVSPIEGHLFKRLPEVGNDVGGYFQAVKYEPPPKIVAGDAAPDHPSFHQYTEIENYYRFPNAIPQGTEVQITEKIHGTQCRLGLINVDGEWQFMAGSHKVNRKQPVEGRCCPYWEQMTEPVMNLLTYLCNEQHNVIVFGEVYGPGVQDMDYGVPRGERHFRVFDISVDGRYMNCGRVALACLSRGVNVVPLLAIRDFTPEFIDKLTNGDTSLRCSRSFKSREGIVITPMIEQHSDVLNGRMILKSVSADYLDRKNAQDNGELESA
jgi:RNA ligase (TIGR02306 family)